MNAKEFQKELKGVVSKFPNVKESNQYSYEVETVLGTWLFSAEYKPRIKLANIHSRFKGESYSIELFRALIGGDEPSTFTQKWNHYSSDPIYILDWLEETLENFKWMDEQQSEENEDHLSSIMYGVDNNQ